MISTGMHHDRPGPPYYIRPIYNLPDAHQRPGLHFSIIEGIDGFLASFFSIRLHRDALAPSAAESVCVAWGLPSYESLGCAVSLFFGDQGVMPHAVACAASHRACGVFIVPADAADMTAMPTIDSPAGSMPWLVLLRTQRVFQLTIPDAAFTPAPITPMVALLAHFGTRNVSFKKRNRPERALLTMQLPVYRLPPDRHRLRPTPRLPHRISPLAAARCPTVHDDVAPASDPFSVVSPSPDPIIRPLPSPWKLAAFRAMTSDYPFPAARDIGLRVMEGTLDPFQGDRTKAVDLRAPQHSQLVTRLLREKMLADAARGFVAGPLTAVPFTNARICNLFGVPKHRYIESEELRVVHHLSEASAHQRHKGTAPGSINALSFNPHWIAIYFSVRWLCDTLAHFGHGVRMAWRDVPKAFKRNPTHAELLFLFVSQLRLDDTTVEYYVELCNVFGWVPSEWGWQAVSALIDWWLDRAGVTHMFNFVDNYWHIHPPGSDWRSRDAQADAEFARMGLDTHEEGSGTLCPAAMGWELDLDARDHPRGWRMIMTCPMDKWAFYCPRFSAWAMATHHSLDDLASAAGITAWLVAGLPMGLAYLPAIYAARTRAERSELSSTHPGRLHLISSQAREGLQFFDRLLRDWDRTCPIISHFGPQAAAQRFGWVDAATLKSHGCGGILWDPATRILLGFTHVWDEHERGLAECEQRESTGVLECIGIEIWLRVFAELCTALRTRLSTDNESAMLAWQNCYSPTPHMLSAIRTSRLAAGRHHVILDVTQVKGSVFNKIADALSHLCVADARRHARAAFGADVKLVLLSRE
jgi:hypothetical protein